MHFMKCGTVLKVNILTDAITGHPKGAACITFADRESIEKAVSLSGTSFLTRVLTVMRKADAPPGFLASVQQAGRPLQPWKSPPLKTVTPKKASGYHLQWKRDQSVLEISPASCATN
jgi:RNA recognition motif-containing protein